MPLANVIFKPPLPGPPGYPPPGVPHHSLLRIILCAAYETDPSMKTPEMSHKMADIDAARDFCFSVLAMFSALVETNEQSRATSANNSDNTIHARSPTSPVFAS